MPTLEEPGLHVEITVMNKKPSAPDSVASGQRLQACSHTMNPIADRPVER
jgi:hypothetical protein